MRRSTTRLAIAATMLLMTFGAPTAAGPLGGALPPVLIEALRIAGEYGIPEDAEMVAANVTAVGPADAGHITVFPCDEDVPETSNLNYVADDIAPNLTLTRLSATGTICVSTYAVSDVIVDLVGYVPAGSAIEALPNPVRFIDTRESDPQPLAAGSTTEIPIAGRNGVGADADVVLFNLTAIGADRPGHLTAYPCGEARPETSSVNYAPGQVVPNMVTSRIGERGSVCVHNFAPAEIIVDVAASATSGITALTNPVRVTDTRLTGAPVSGDATLTIDVRGRPDVPATATAAVYNLTSANATGPGFATSYPCDVPRPFVSNLNYDAGSVSANGTITKLSGTGEVCIYALAQTHLIVDLIGYTEGTTEYVPLTPERIWDSREGWQRTCDWLAFRLELDVVEFWNLSTERLVSVDVAGLRGSPKTPYRIVGSPCGTVLAQVDGGDGRDDLVRVGLDGSMTLVIDGLPESVALRDVGFDGARYIGTTSSDEVWDLTNGVKLADGSGQVGWYTHVSDDGSTVVDSVRDGTTSTVITTFDGASGTELGTFEVPAATTAVPSPDGKYVALPLSSTQVAIFTAYGDQADLIELTRVPHDPRIDLITAAWVGDGELVLCQRTWTVYRYALFSEPELVTTLPQKLSPGGNSGQSFCPATP